MYDGLPRRWGRLARRMLVPDRRVRRALREVADLLPTALFERPSPAPGFVDGAMAGKVVDVAAFGDNPGRLHMKLYLPAPAPRPGAPLLVLLHGCGQDATRFAESSGFAALADQLGAVLLLPDQRTENNHYRCFNWFSPADTRRGDGEAASIRQMVDEALRRFRGDPARVFIAGLSAGGALTAALLAAYPDVFAAGGVVAGLPVGAAENAQSALVQMSHPQGGTREAWAARVPRSDTRRWPRLSVWHGEADQTVDPANGELLVGQWTALLGLPATPDTEEFPAPRLRHRVWGDAVEHWSLAGYGHAFPIAEGASADPFVLPADIAAVDAMARFWGLEAG